MSIVKKKSNYPRPNKVYINKTTFDIWTRNIDELKERMNVRKKVRKNEYKKERKKERKKKEK